MGLGEKSRQWFEAQIEGCAPPETLSSGGIGRAVQDLAGATAAFEAGGGQAFGLTLDADREELAPLAARSRELLGRWRTRLLGEHGAEGGKLVDTIAARHGLNLPSMRSAVVDSPEPLPAPVTAVLDKLARALADDEGRRAWLVERGGSDDEDSGVEVGEPDRAELEAFFARFEANSDGKLPRAYFELLSRWNGISTGGETSKTVASTELVEPIVWPLESYGDHFMFDDVDLEGIEEAFVFGEVADIGMLAFDTMEPDAPVFWLERRTTPVQIATSLVEFLDELADHHFEVLKLLGTRKVWG